MAFSWSSEDPCGDCPAWGLKAGNFPSGQRGWGRKSPCGRFGDGELWGFTGIGMENVGICRDGDGERKLPETGNGDRDGEHFRWRRIE
ncbi:hypothetical protein A2U01_0037160, partial [Trifolium medium]|nr:hypothetical protein [Trifolium medium]